MKRIVICTLFIAFAIDLLFILVICIPHTQYSLPMNRMIRYPLVCCIGYVLFTILVGKLRLFNDNTIRLQKILLLAYLAVYSALLYWCCTRLNCPPRPLTDDAQVRNQALYLAGMSDISNWPYFATFGNNVPSMLALSCMLQLGGVLDWRTLCSWHSA